MLESYDGYTAGDKVTYEGSELELLGFDFEAQRWACKQPKKQEDGSVQNWYLWVASLRTLNSLTDRARVRGQLCGPCNLRLYK